MANIFIVVENEYSYNKTYVPTYIFKDKDAIIRGFEYWYENVPHFCISDDGIFYKIKYNVTTKEIFLERRANIPSNKNLFSELLLNYFDLLQNSIDEVTRLAAIRAKEIWSEHGINAIDDIALMARSLDFD